MPSGEGLDFGLGERGEVGSFVRDDASCEFWVMLFEVSQEHISGVARAGTVPDQLDFARRRQTGGNLVIERGILRDTVTLIMRLFTMQQMMVKVMRIVGLERFLISHALDTPAKNMRRVMIDYDEHSTGTVHRDRRQFGRGGLEQAPHSRYVLHRQFTGVRSLEKLPLRADDECEFAAISRLDFPDMLNEFKSIVPM